MPVTAAELDMIQPVEIANRVPSKIKIFPSVSIDSRTIEAGAVFIAIRGEKHDGHSYIAGVAEQAGAIVADTVWREQQREGLDALRHVPIYVVHDTVQALGRLGNIHRRQFTIPVIAVTGSSGKTTTKDMIVRVLGQAYRIHSTRGNLNNHLGLPLTLMELTGDDRISVVEIGMNHPGEIDYLCSIAEPTHGLITNIGKGHLGYFDSLEAVAREKGRLFRWIEGDSSRTAFVNADDERIEEQAHSIPLQKRYGFESENVSVKGRRLEQNNDGCYAFQFTVNSKVYRIQLRVPGKHQTKNALAAVTIGLTFGVAPDLICNALESFQPPAKRSVVREIGGILVYDDSYNANPDSMRAALETFSEMRTTGKKVLVLGDMLELGVHSGEEHGRLGLKIPDLGFEYLFTYGPEAEALYAAACTPFGGHYTDKKELVRDLFGILESGDAVLVKGSRGMRMEEVIVEIEKRYSEIKKNT
jgi:UDP-N-acetylmuramoyl-tripeptide--D-alanyl-D-alanine ligase